MQQNKTKLPSPINLSTRKGIRKNNCSTVLFRGESFFSGGSKENVWGKYDFFWGKCRFYRGIRKMSGGSIVYSGGTEKNSGGQLNIGNAGHVQSLK